MKKKLLLFFSCALMFSISKAQLHIGPAAGVQISRLAFFDQPIRDKYQSAPSVGFDIGVMASMRVQKKFVLGGSLVYSEKGKTVKGKEDVFYRNRLRMQYIEMPLFYTYEFSERLHKNQGKGGLTKAYKLFLGGGPTIGYWLGGRGKFSSSNLKESEIETLHYKVIFNHDDNELTKEDYGDKMNVEEPTRFQFGLNITGGAAFEPNKNQKIIVAAHIELGQSFMSRTTDGYFPISFVDQDPLRAKIQSIRLSVGYLFDMKLQEKVRGKSTKDHMIRRRKR